MIDCVACGNQNDAGARFCSECGSRLVSTPPTQVRKTVSVLFCDLVDSTALGERLDPEATRAVLDGYFRSMRQAIERHGGVVEKYIGDAVMAVFGLPRAHEDDALRAARAALDMKEALGQINEELQSRYDVVLGNRTGITTGEVVTGDAAAGQRLVTGDAVNVAARLQQLASPGETIVDDATWRLVQRYVTGEALAPLTVKGKAVVVSAHVLTGLGPASAGGRLSRFVGRADQLAELLKRFEAASSKRRLALLTMVGEAGVGKSRLVSEFGATIADRATVYRTGCLSYGEGITYWPLAELVRAAASITDRHTAPEAIDRIRRIVSPPAADHIGSVVGLGGDASREDAAAAINILLATLARERPVVWIIEDAHWAESALLDLVEGASALAPVLLLVTARQDLVVRRPDWPIDVTLEPLSGVDVADLLSQTQLTARDLERVRLASGGNPLFAEQLAAFVTEQVGPTTLPPSLSVLLTARLDGLPEGARWLAQMASVEGDTFHLAALQPRAPDDVRVSIGTLSERQIVREAEPQFAGQPAYGFNHSLMREAAYSMLPKRARAYQHEHIATWLIDMASTRQAEYDEVVGYHLEQSFIAHSSIERPGDEVLAISRRAGERLAAAGRRAERRDDMAAAKNLLGRALTLLPPHHADRSLALGSLARVEHNLGDVARADELYGEAIDAAASTGATGAETFARLERVIVRFDRGLASVHEFLAEAEHAASVLDPLDKRLARSARYAITLARNNAGNASGALMAAELLLAQATSEGNTGLAAAAVQQIAWALAYGPTPAHAAARRIATLLTAHPGAPYSQVISLRCQASCEAMAGKFAAARTTLGAARQLASASSLAYLEAFMDWTAGQIERLAGATEPAERLMRRACDWYDSMGIAGVFSTVATELADVLCDLGRLDEAKVLTERSEAATQSGDVLSEVGWRRVRARVLACLGRPTDGRPLAEDAIAIAEQSDFLDLRVDAYVAQAEVMMALGGKTAASAGLKKSIELCRAKGNVSRAALLTRRYGRPRGRLREATGTDG